MAISTEKELHASERFMLVKMTPGRYIVDDLSSIGGSDYSMSFPFPYLSGVKRNGAALTLVTSLSGNDQYTWDGATLTVRLASAPDEDTNVLVAFYDLFFTGGQARYAPDDPESTESANNPLREWNPVIEKYPSLSQTIRNIEVGVVTIASSSLVIIDDDFEKYLTINDSFSNKDIQIWQCINSISNIQKIFSGQVKSISIRETKISFSIFDPFTKFNSSAFMGDSDTEAIAQRSALSYPSLFPDDANKPIPYYFSNSKHTIYYDQYFTYRISYLREGINPYCISYDESNPPSTSNNRQYVIGRVGSNGLVDFDYGTTSQYTSPAAGVYYYNLSGDNLIGLDNFAYSSSRYWVLYRGPSFSYSGNNYNCIIARESGSDNLPSNLASVSTAEKPPTLWIENSDGTVTLLFWVIHFTYSTSVTSGGNKEVTITLNSGASSPETAYSIDPIDPKNVKISAMIQPADTYTHGELVKKLCEDADIATNAATFTAADSALSANIAMSIPTVDENAYSTTIKYIEQILRSTLGYLVINNDNEAEYTLLASPSTGEDIDGNLTIKGSRSNNIDYNDINTTVIASNDHVPKVFGSEGVERVDSQKAKFLHGITKTFEFKHVLDDISGRIDAIATVMRSRKRRYSFDVATQLVDAVIGDDVSYSDKSDVNIKITSIKKDGSRVSIEADDLGEL